MSAPRLLAPTRRLFFCMKFLALAAPALPGGLHGAAGEPDLSFGSGGMLRLDLVPDAVPGTSDFSISDMARLPDGKLLCVSGNWLARLDAEGRIDPTFGHEGILPLALNAVALEVQKDGRIVLAGQVSTHLAVTRLLENGSPDPEFAGGAPLVELLSSTTDYATDVQMQDDGKIVVCGGAVNGIYENQVVLRYDANGSRDPGFGTNGVSTIVFPGANRAMAMTLQRDGKVVVAGYGAGGLVVNRLLPNGATDTGFGVAGRFLRTSGGVAYGVVAEDDGHLLIAGAVGASSYPTWGVLLRLGGDGTLDPAFGNRGVVLTTLPNTSIAGREVRRLENGKILMAAGFSLPGYLPTESGLLRYLPNGVLDTDFGNGGSVRQGLQSSPETLATMTLLPDGSVLTAGSKSNGGQRIGQIRKWESDGTPLNFGGGNATAAVIRLPGSTDTAAAVAVAPDGKIIVAGSVAPGSSTFAKDFAVARLLPDGSLDRTFAGKGVQTTSLAAGASTDTATSVALQTDGKILVAGSANDRNSGSPIQGGLVRYRHDGTLDPSFGAGTGKILIPHGQITQVAIMQGGKILTATAGSSEAKIVRHFSDGRIDPGFGTNGVFTYKTTATSSPAIVLQPDNKILAAVAWFENQSHVVRLLPTGQLDESFGSAGVVRLLRQGGSLYMPRICLQSDGKIVVAGSFSTTPSGSSRAVVMRLQSDGSVDTDFGDQGSTLWQEPAVIHTSNALTVMPDGKIILAGTWESSGEKRPILLRIKSNGQIDTGFGVAGLHFSKMQSTDFVALAAQANGAAVAISTMHSIYGADIGIARIQGGPYLSLAGAGKPDLSTGTALDLGVVTVGRKGELELEMRNTGSSPLSVSALEVAGSGFSATGPSAEVLAGGSVPLRIHFAPAGSGPETGSLRILSNAENQPDWEAALTATGNFPPVFPGYVISTPFGRTAWVAAAKLLARTADPEMDPVALRAAGPSTQMGGHAALEALGLRYQPPPDFSGVDAFPVTFVDARGAETSGFVSVTVGPPPDGGGATLNPPRLIPQADGVEIRFHGIPGRIYGIQRSTDMITWVMIAQMTADAAGTMTYTDPQAPRPTAFYRLALP